MIEHVAPSIPLTDPAPGHVWSDDEPDVPDALRLSPAAIAARAEQRARIDVEQAATSSTAAPGSTPIPGSPSPPGSAAVSASADPAAHGLLRSRRRPARSATAATRARAAAARAEFESATWPTFTPPALGTATGPMAEVMAAERALAGATATRARALSALAQARPASDDRPAGTPGAMSAERRAARPDVLEPVSEWVVRELRVSLAVTDTAADRMLVQALTLTRRLPGVLAALEGGLIHCGHLPALLELLDPITDDTLRARIEAELLRWLAARGAAGTITTPAQLRAKTHRVLLARDARTQAETLRRALATRGVFLTAEPVPGMSGIYLRMTTAEAAALYTALGQLGDHLPDDDLPGDDLPGDTAEGTPHGTADRPPRSRAEKMLDVLIDSVLRPGTSSQPPVQVSLTVVTALQTLLGGDTPGEIDGHLVPATQIRALLDLLTGSNLTGDHEAEDAEAGADADRSTDSEPTEPEPTAESSAAHAPSDASVGTTSEPAGTPDITDAVRTRYAEPPPLDDATYWAMVDQLIDRAPDPDDLWWGADDPVWPENDPTCAVGTAWPDDGSDAFANAPHSSVPAPSCRARTTSGAATSPAEEVRPQTVQHALDAVTHAETAHARLHAALRSADDAVAAAQTAAAHDEATWHAHHGDLHTATDSLDALRAALPQRTAALHDLLAATPATTGGGLAHRPRIALTHALTGALVSLTDLPGLHAAAATGTDLGPPPDTDHHRPAAALDRHVRTRDRRCRTPGCRRPASRGELDHHVPHPQGPTSAANLCGLCVTDHRGKHQAPGWHHHLHPDGTYTVTTPAGLTARTTPTPVL